MGNENVEITMTKELLIFLFVDGEIHSQHVVKLPAYGEKRWYTSTLSWDAFSTRENTRVHKAYVASKILPKYCTVWRADEWHRSEDIVREIFLQHGTEWLHPWEKSPKYEHASIFDFYKAVGYDLKKKRFVEEQV